MKRALTPLKCRVEIALAGELRTLRPSMRLPAAGERDIRDEKPLAVACDDWALKALSGPAFRVQLCVGVTPRVSLLLKLVPSGWPNWPLAGQLSLSS